MTATTTPTTAVTTATPTTEIILSLLSDGVPTAPIARAFSIDQATVKSLQATIRTKVYGSSEISELLAGLMFEAYESARIQLRTGNPAAKAAMIKLILSRALSLVGRQSPEEFERLRSEMLNLLTDMSTQQSEVPSMYADPAFSPIETDTDTTTDDDDDNR